MMVYKFRKKVKNFFIDNFNFIKICIQSFFTKPKSKAIYFDITGIALNRYLYNLIQFFKLSGFTIYLPKDKKMIRVLSKNDGEFRFASWILNGDIKIGIPQIKDEVYFLTKEVLSNDYFNSDYKERLSKVYEVPMSQFPYMYSINEEKDSINLLLKRKQSVFTCGNFNRDLYSAISKNITFNTFSRREIVDFIYLNNYYYKIDSYSNLVFFIENNLDNKVLLIDSTKDFNIDFRKLKSVLKKFDFYLALPGILVPQSHNLIEAMEMGCIPIIHKNYSNLLSPPLIHLETAIVYQTKKELDGLVKEVFEWKENKVIYLRENVLHYYEMYLSPKAVVDTLINNEFDKVLIQAEHISLRLLKKSTI